MKVINDLSYEFNKIFKINNRITISEEGRKSSFNH